MLAQKGRLKRVLVAICYMGGSITEQETFGLKRVEPQ